MGSTYSYVTKPDTTPLGNTEPTFDPLYGFPEGRKRREMIATEQEMKACRIDKERRDYCAHKFIELEQCRFENAPWFTKCARHAHEWNQCYYDDYVLRMKEYERERRLLERKKRKESLIIRDQAVAA